MENVFCNEKYIKYCLINFAAPVLEKQKPAGLMTIWKYHLDEYTKEKLRRMDRWENVRDSKIEVLYETKLYFLLLCYQEEMMEQELQKKIDSSVLIEYVNCLGTNEKLELLKYKLEQHYLGKAEFPHEVGLFLGYPIWDVEGFIVHKGQDYKLCGYWKVYDDVPGALLKFKKYDTIRKRELEQFYKNEKRNNQKL